MLGFGKIGDAHPPVTLLASKLSREARPAPALAKKSERRDGKPLRIEIIKSAKTNPLAVQENERRSAPRMLPYSRQTERSFRAKSGLLDSMERDAISRREVPRLRHSARGDD
jgi:hypothetical protein